MNTCFLLGLTFILIHEMDAIRCHEWRIIPGMKYLGDRAGMSVFLCAHILLIYWLFNVFEDFMHTEGFLMQGFDISLIINLLLHLLFPKQKNNEFKDWISWIFIVATAAFGLMDQLIVTFFRLDTNNKIEESQA